MNGYATGRGLKGNHGTMRYMAGTPYQILKLLKAHTSNCIILDCKLVVFFECCNPKIRRNYMILTLNLTWLISTKDRHKTYMQGHFDPPTNLLAIFWWIIEANSTDCKTTWWKPPWQISVASKFLFLFVWPIFSGFPKKMGCGGGLEGQCATTWWGKGGKNP